MVFAIRRQVGVFDTPAGPLSKGVIGPIPTVFLKDVDAVCEIGCCAGCPSDGTEFTDDDVGIALALEIADGLELFSECCFVEGLAVEFAGIFDAWVAAVFAPCVVDTLMGELPWPVHMDLIDDVGDVDRC